MSQPVIKNFYKFWWNEELSALKEAAVSSNQLWKAAGKPRQGPIFDKRQLCKARYRKNLRDAQQELSYCRGWPTVQAVKTTLFTSALHRIFSNR